MNAGFKSRVDILDPVAREEEESFVVFEDAEEDRDEFVALEVRGRASFEEDIRFVEKEDCLPFRGHVENLSQ